MNEEHRAATVEFVEYRIEPLVAQVHAVEIGQHDDAVELERVEGVGDLLQRTVDVRKRQAGEAAKTAAMLPNSARGELVDGSREDTCVRVVAVVYAWRRHREHPGRDSHFVHHREGALGAPMRRWKSVRPRPACVDHFLAILGAQVMKVDVDTVAELNCHGAGLRYCG